MVQPSPPIVVNASMKLDELKKICKERRLKGYSGMNKQELL